MTELQSRMWSCTHPLMKLWRAMKRNHFQFEMPTNAQELEAPVEGPLSGKNTLHFELALIL